jgi:hypothetical protein
LRIFVKRMLRRMYGRKRIFEKRVLRRMYGPRRGEATKG